jgi:hypothetical protein
MKHKHYDCIVAWANGAKVQARSIGGDWHDFSHPNWNELHIEYRIKPEPKIDIVQLRTLYKMGNDLVLDAVGNFKLTYCGETGKLKSAEVI